MDYRIRCQQQNDDRAGFVRRLCLPVLRAGMGGGRSALAPRLCLGATDMSLLDRLPQDVLRAVRARDYCEAGRLLEVELKRQRAQEYADCEAGYGDVLASISIPEIPR